MSDCVAKWQCPECGGVHHYLPRYNGCRNEECVLYGSARVEWIPYNDAARKQLAAEQPQKKKPKSQQKPVQQTDLLDLFNLD